MFTTIDAAELADVVGGQNTDDVTAGPFSVRRNRTDYRLCVQEVVKAGGTPQDIRDTCGQPPR
jgi:hypothetical protein